MQALQRRLTQAAAAPCLSTGEGSSLVQQLRMLSMHTPRSCPREEPAGCSESFNLTSCSQSACDEENLSVRRVEGGARKLSSVGMCRASAESPFLANLPRSHLHSGNLPPGVPYTWQNVVREDRLFRTIYPPKPSGSSLVMLTIEGRGLLSDGALEDLQGADDEEDWGSDEDDRSGGLGSSSGGGGGSLTFLLPHAALQALQDRLTRAASSTDADDIADDTVPRGAHGVRHRDTLHGFTQGSDSEEAASEETLSSEASGGADGGSGSSRSGGPGSGRREARGRRRWAPHPSHRLSPEPFSTEEGLVFGFWQRCPLG